jgi:hypothetical protein
MIIYRLPASTPDNPQYVSIQQFNKDNAPSIISWLTLTVRLNFLNSKIRDIFIASANTGPLVVVVIISKTHKGASLGRRMNIKQWYSFDAAPVSKARRMLASSPLFRLTISPNYIYIYKNEKLVLDISRKLA